MLQHNVHNLPADQMLQRITNFVEHLHREDHFDHDGHERDIEKLEQEFHMNNAGPREILTWRCALVFAFIRMSMLSCGEM